MTAAGQIVDAAHLRTLPDGTIISWLRIPGDPTSAAVAFVRREVEYDDGPVGPTVHGGPHVTVWISPGGWDPQTIESAGVTFPCQVIRWGEFSVDAVPAGELPLLAECIHGGTWAREKALECATRLYAGALAGGSGIQIAEVMKDASRFEEWLDRDSDPSPLDEPGFLAPRPEDQLSTRLMRAYEAINEAREKFGPTVAAGLAVEGVRSAAMILAEQGE